MSGIHLVASDPDLESEKMAFSDLIKHLGKSLASAQTVSNLEEVMKSLSKLMKRPENTAEDKSQLRRLRQRGYDLKRTLKQSTPDLEKERGSNLQPDLFQTIDKNITDNPPPRSSDIVQEDLHHSQTKEVTMQSIISEVPKSSETTHSLANPHSSNKMIDRIALKFDIEKLMTALPKVLLLGGSTIAVLWLFWLQSVELYRSSGFSSPEIVALGGIFMVVGFAAYHSRSHSKVAFLCCLYIGAYEAYFIGSGTISNESRRKSQDPALLKASEWAQEKVAKAKSEYDHQKSRYENPGSREYQSSWFKKNHLDPAWKEYSKAQEQLGQNIKDAKSTNEFDHVGWLKIFYRLGLVLLSMLLVHKFVRLWPKVTTKQQG